MSSDLFVVEYVDKVKEIFEKNRNDKKAVKMKKYMRNKFEFYGIQAIKRRELSSNLQKKENRLNPSQLNRVVMKLWSEDERELHYFAMELLERYKNEFRIKDIKLMVHIIKNKSWWDTVDFIAKKLIGEYFNKHPKYRHEYIKKWIRSNNIWLQRTTLIFQLAYKDSTEQDILFSNIKKLKDIDDFFIQKAIGWALREYSKIEPNEVEKFINNIELSNLSKREGLKQISKK